MNHRITCHKLLLGINLITISSQGLRKLPQEAMEWPGVPCPTGFFRVGPGLPSEQGGRGREQEKRVAKTGGNEQQRALAKSANFSGFLRGPARGTRSREAKQWQVVLRTGQDRRRLECALVSSLAAGPSSAGSEELPHLWGHRDKGQCRPGCQEPEARSRHRTHAAPPRGPCAGGSACGPAVTALRRGPARPAGSQRGWLWHTTGADLQGRTRGLALSSTFPRRSHTKLKATP